MDHNKEKNNNSQNKLKIFLKLGNSNTTKKNNNNSNYASIDARSKSRTERNVKESNLNVDSDNEDENEDEERREDYSSPLSEHEPLRLKSEMKESYNNSRLVLEKSSSPIYSSTNEAGTGINSSPIYSIASSLRSSSPISNYEIKQQEKNVSSEQGSELDSALSSLPSSPTVTRKRTSVPKIILRLPANNNNNNNSNKEVKEEEINSDSELDVENEDLINNDSNLTSLLNEKENEANNGVTNVTNNKNKSKKSKKSGKSSNKTNNNQRQPKELNSVLTKMLNDIIRKDSYGIFYEPVNAKEVPDYYIVIKKPMNFQLMKRKLKSGNYLTLEAFLKDIELICNNAMIYNQKDTIFYKMAEKILSFASNLADKEKAYILPNTSFIGKSEMLDVENNLQYDNDNDNSNNNVNTTTMSNQESNYQENTQSAPTTKRYKKHKKNLNNHIRSNYLSDGSMRYNYFIQKQNDNNNTNEKQSYLSYLDNSNNPNNNLILDDHLYLNFGNSQGLSYLTSIARFTADLDSTLITESVNKHFNDITLNSHQFSNNIKNILDKNK